MALSLADQEAVSSWMTLDLYRKRPGGQALKSGTRALVLDSVSSPITKRVYNMALDEFMVWFQAAPRPGYTKATVSAWRVSLEDRGLGSSSIIIRMSAIRKLAAEAADNGVLAPELAAGISRPIRRHELLNNGDAKMPNGESGSFPLLKSERTPSTLRTETFRSPEFGCSQAIFCELTGRDFPHQNKWLPGMDSNLG